MPCIWKLGPVELFNLTPSSHKQFRHLVPRTLEHRPSRSPSIIDTVGTTSAVKMAIDADLARMLADLGPSHRDDVSAPPEVRGNVASNDPREAARIRAEAQARRKELSSAGAGSGDGHAVILSRWNSKTTFMCLQKLTDNDNSCSNLRA